MCDINRHNEALGYIDTNEGWRGNGEMNRRQQQQNHPT